MFMHRKKINFLRYNNFKNENENEKTGKPAVSKNKNKNKPKNSDLILEI